MNNLKDILRDTFVAIMAILFIFAIYSLLTEPIESGEILGLIMNSIVLIWLYSESNKTSYPHKWFIRSLGMLNLWGVLIWIVIRPEEKYKNIAKSILVFLIALIIVVILSILYVSLI